MPRRPIQSPSSRHAGGARANAVHIATTLLVAFFPASAVFADGLPDRGTILALLDSPVLADRDHASSILLADESITIRDIEDMLSSDRLTPEQQIRLLAVGREIFARTPKAGLGVQFAPQRLEAGTRLDGVLDNFPAAGLLRAGDIILAINAQPIANSAHMGEIILSHEPGEILVMDIARPIGPLLPGRDVPVERLTVEVPLGRFDDLQAGAVPIPARLEGAFLHRLARAGVGHEPAAVGLGRTPIDWLRTEGYDETPAIAPVSTLHHVAAWRVIAFGGQPGSSVAEVEMRRGDANAAFRRMNIALRADGVYDRTEEALAGYRALVGRLSEIRRQIELGTGPAEPGGLLTAQRLRRLREERAEIESGLAEIVEFLSGIGGRDQGPAQTEHAVP